MSTGGTRPEKRCTYANCDRPEHGSDFHQIEAGRRSGDRTGALSLASRCATRATSSTRGAGRLKGRGISRSRLARGGQSHHFFPPQSRLPPASPAHRMNFCSSPSFRAGVVGDSPPCAVGKAHPVRNIVACIGINFMLAREVEREVEGGAIVLPSQKIHADRDGREDPSEQEHRDERKG